MQFCLSRLRKEVAKLGKDIAKSHSKDLRAGKCVLRCEIYRAQSVELNLFLANQKDCGLHLIT